MVMMMMMILLKEEEERSLHHFHLFIVKTARTHREQTDDRGVFVVEEEYE